MEFPLEILDQILAGLVVYEPLRKVRGITSMDEWTSFTSTSGKSLVDPRYKVGSGRSIKFNREKLPSTGGSFSRLRLVSRQWNFSVCRILQKHAWWNIPFDNRSRLKLFIQLCDAPDGGPSRWIRNLSIDDLDDLRTFSRLYSYDYEKFEGQDVDDDYIILNSYVDKLRTADWWTSAPARFKHELHYGKSDEHALLRRLLDNVKRIERFSITFPGAVSKHDLMAQCYDMQGLDEILATIRYGLASPAFQHLADLSLAVPSTWHVGQLAGALSQDARDRLRQLRLVIVDETGPSGSAEYTRTEEENNDGDRTTILGSVAPSNAQVAYPNREHQDALWAFVASCPNLESLGIEATHYLNLDILQWESPKFGTKNLRNLSLRRLWANVPSLLQLLSAAPLSKQDSVIRRVNLDDIKIHWDGGNWEDVFAHLRTNCPGLELFRAEQLTYFSNHPRYEHNNRPWENYNDIWTDDYEGDTNDRLFLRMLNKNLVDKIGTVEDYPVSLYDWYESEMEGE
ncbi:hypothetical protein CORC01_02495 [Colletotrichum orchidophilum]|uniref:Uncharacterized protein n=1 Tax=Colletotrichum orchidophilum TaxID=1209926 RepID=A0A1G4BLK5_9PEZI|nr:uncharacterized protein CORC01_02495 [Colletotrichum orchidophilum]OHF02215.1 hypothetical protein CORC01_02495 [Colletotrichum orchidophilum]